MSSWPPVVADFQTYFARDFIFGATLDTVEDADVQRALNEASLVFNPGLWANAADRQSAYLYVAAHFLALNIQGAGGLSLSALGRGVQSSGGGAIESKSVGGVSVSYALPDIVRQSPILSQFMRTGYGQMYLAILTPRLVGNIMVVGGAGSPDWTDPIIAAGGYIAGNTMAPLAITTASLPAGVHSVVYSQTLAATGGLAPLAWTLTNGTLPPGLTLSTAGILSGTPTTAGTYYFTTTVTDPRGATSAQNYQMVIS